MIATNVWKPAGWFALGAVCATTIGRVVAHVSDTPSPPRSIVEQVEDAYVLPSFSDSVAATGELNAYWEILARRVSGSSKEVVSLGHVPLLASAVGVASPWDDLQRTVAALDRLPPEQGLAPAKDLATAVQRAAWTLMQAELLNHDQVGRVESAWWAFQDGLEQLDKLTVQFEQMDPLLELEFTNQSPEVAMIYDAVLARRAMLNEMQEAAFTTMQERHRISLELIANYRMSLGHLAAATRDSQLGRLDDAAQHFEASQRWITNIDDLVALATDQHVEFLFVPEPPLDEENPPLEPLLITDASQAIQTATDVKVLRALSLLDAADRGLATDRLTRLEAADDILSDAAVREGNPLAEYVYGRIQEALALALTSNDPSNAELRTRAEGYFADALAAWERAAAAQPAGIVLVDEHDSLMLADASPDRGTHLRLATAMAADDMPIDMLADIIERAGALEERDVMVAQVWDRLQSGQPQAAWQQAQAVIERHSTPPAWHAYIVAGLHAEIDLDRLLAPLENVPADESVLKDVLERDYWAGLVLFHKARESQRRGDAAADDLYRRAREHFLITSAQLNDAPGSEGTHAACLIYQLACEMANTEESRTPLECQIRINQLEQAIQLLVNQIERPDSTIEPRETLAIAYQVLSKLHRELSESDSDGTRLDETHALAQSLAAQTAAHQQLRDLPYFRWDVDLVDSQLLALAETMPSSQEMQQLSAEWDRQFTVSQQRLARGMFQISLGDELAAREAFQGARMALGGGIPPSPLFPPSDASNSPAEWLEQLQAHHPDVLRTETVAFGILQEHPITGLQPHRAMSGEIDELLRDAISLESADDVSPQACLSALDNMTSPLQALTLGWLLYSNAVSLPEDEASERQDWIAAADKALSSADLLMTPQTNERFPVVQGMISRLRTRLSDPAAVLAEAAALRAGHEYASALRLLDEGLHIHSRDFRVWLDALDLYETLARRNLLWPAEPIPLSDMDHWEALLPDLDSGAESSWHQHYLAGRIAEARGDVDAAITHLGAALDILSEVPITDDVLPHRQDILARLALHQAARTTLVTMPEAN